MAKIKVACIGDPSLHAFLAEEFPEWDWQIPVETIHEFYGEMGNGIDLETRAIFIYDGLFDPSGEDNSFEDAIARLAPYALIAILNYNKEHNSTIQRLVSNAAANNAWDEEKFYFIDDEQPLISIEQAISEAIQRHGSPEVVEAFSTGQSVAPMPVDDEPEDVYADYSGPRSVVQNTEKLGKVICVTSSKGGSGKSTVAISLAGYIARASAASKRDGLEKDKLSVAIVDLDVRDGQLGFVTGRTTPTVLNIALKDEVSVQTVRESSIWNEGLACDLYLAPKSARSHEEVPPQFYNELIQTLRSMYDYVILDTSVNYLDPLLEEVAYPSADQIIFVTDLGIQSVFGMTRWIKEVTGAGIGGDIGMGVNRNKVGIVVNKTMANVGMNPDKIKKASVDIPILTNLPSMPTMVTAAANAKRLQDLTKNKEFNQYMRILAKAVVGRGYSLSHIS